MTGAAPAPVVAVLGASGLIGEALCSFLLRKGYRVVPVARRFTPAQEAAWRGRTLSFPLVDADEARLRAALAATGADVVVNCVGVLQDAPGSSAGGANHDFVARLLSALQTQEPRSPVFVHISIPGQPEDDRTDFSRGKRAAEAAIAASALSHIILRPGFVLAGAAYGGSALMRALAVLPFDLPRTLADRPFAVTDAADIGRTIAFLLDEWQAGRRDWRASWDVMEEKASSVGEVLSGLATRLAGPRRRIRLPGWGLAAASAAGDVVSRFGWRPPVRSTALAEMRRGVTGDTSGWREATGLMPSSGPDTLATIAATVQERWFARLYALKALVLGILVPFWIVSGGIAISVAFGPAVGILTDHGFGEPLAKAVTVATSLMDISIGILIANRRTCRLGLSCGIALSLLYMISAAIITPAMWIEPLGALVKTGPAIVLMMVGLAVFEDR
ncbi:SDR family oxidoreductase [Aureimonas psammosilenae]|uniref:SDR family oxidoreductase n=1 Tax=Aureimonas psammosilenae TaxID=2495496 RepID=UPI00126117D1|nr:SDR family oxidoreductase [Aureimonas psammosilenae]